MMMLMTTTVLASILTAQATPSGRPPIGPLERHDPRLFDVYMEVSVRTELTPLQRTAPGRPARIDLDLRNAEVLMPVIMRSTFSSVDHDTINFGLWLEDREVDVREEARLEGSQPFHASRVVLPIQEFRSDRFRWRVGYQTQVWSSRINDSMAAEVDWPDEWPAEVRDGLRPQRFIESNDPIFTEAVERITEGRLREVPPYYAAKDLVRYVLQNVQIEEGGEFRGAMAMLTGMNINGAKAAASTGKATPHDLVCACVAMLRAANIPARPVVGMQRRPGPRVVHEFVSWAEFYLPGAGWVPFDPVAMRGKGLHRHVSEPWPEFGTMRDLNTRVPLSFHFTPQDASPAPEYPAIWGWNPRGSGRGIAETRQEVRLSMASQGRGRPDAE